MSILVEILKISILVVICEKSRFWFKFCKSRILAEIFENLDFVRTLENLDFGRKFRKMSILIEILKKKESRFWSEF